MPGATDVLLIPATRDGRLEDGTPCERIDLADDASVLAALDRIAPDLLINAAAYTAVDRAEDEESLARRINGEAVGIIGEWAVRHGARMVHYSTDYVFDGSAARAYREDDATHPLGAYGRSKLAGELALRASGARHLLFRSAWVYAPRGHNFLRTMLQLGAERAEVRVVDDQVGAPTPARRIAEATVRALGLWYADAARADDARTDDTRADDTRADDARADDARTEVARPGDALADDQRPLDGTYHLTASGQTSWCGFAREIFARAVQRGLLARAPRVVPIGTAEFPTRAQRPAYSVLDCARFRATFGIALPDWEACLDEVLGES